jgi:hypothetical protein
MKPRDATRESRTDWRRFAAAADDRIDTSDIPKLDEDFFREASAPAQGQAVFVDDGSNTVSVYLCFS